MTELPAKINVGDAVFKNVPRKQEPRSRGLSISRTITNEDLEAMVRRRTAEPILAKLAPSMLADLASGLVSGIVNAGPCVVDIRLRAEYDPALEAHKITASTPLIRTKTYGPEVKSADLVVTARGEAPAERVTPETIWSRVKRWVNVIGRDEVYNGPRGFLDQ